MYAIIATRPDIAFVVGKFRQFSHNPTVRHYMWLDKILCYLKEIVNLGLFYDYSSTTLTIKPIGFIDSAYVDDSFDRHFTHSMTMNLGQATCIWSNTKQRTISISTTEAKYVALC